MAASDNIVDPNEIIIADSFNKLGLNGMPDYSKMYLFVELTAKRRGGSVLVSQSVGSSTSKILQDETDAININMMGFDQDTGNYTTRWSRNFSDNQKNYEGFGITEININTNSSYVPIVDIEFVDVRGASLFTSGSKSPYSVLFSFPPPIFTLTVKGYYGKALTYNLHLVRQSSKFDAQTGNYYISANFVAQKFAPLTDVLFKYIDVVPLMDENSGNSGIDFDFTKPPKNTRELIIRAQKLYDDLDQFKSNSELANSADKLRADFNTSQSVLSSINNFKNKLDISIQNLSGLYIKDQANSTNGNDDNLENSTSDRFIETTLQEYNFLIKSESPNFQSSKIKSRLFIAVKFANADNTAISGTSVAVVKRIKSNLTNLKLTMLSEASSVNGNIKEKSNDIKDPKEIMGSDDRYYGIDITDFYIKTYQDIESKRKKFELKQTEFKDKVNTISVSSLGKTPTIKFIFEILCNDVDKFFTKLKDVDSLAEKHHQKHFNKIVTNNQSTKKTISPFPLVKKKTIISNLNDSATNTIEREERAYPDDVFKDIETFPEVQFVEGFIKTFLDIIKSDEVLDLKEGTDEQGNNKWIPINPLDSVVNGRVNAITPYFGKLNPIPDLITEILNRFYIVTQYSYGDLFYHNDSNAILDFFGVDSKQNDLITFLSQGEAANIVNSIVDSNLLNGLSAQAGQWKTNTQTFYDSLANNVNVNGVNIYKTFEIPGSPSTDLIDDTTSTSFINLNGQVVTKDRKSSKYKGFELLTGGKPDLRNASDDGSNTGEMNIVDKFLDRYSKDTVRNFLFEGFTFSDFTKQNIIYVKDESSSDSGNDDSDFIKNGNLLDSDLFTFNKNLDKTISNTYAVTLSMGDQTLKTILSDPEISNTVKTMIFVSLFGRTLPFFEKDVNKKFAFPSVIEVPKFAYLYMGGLAYFYRNPTSLINSEIDTYNEKYSSFLAFSKTKIAAATQIKNISEIDANVLIEYFTNFAEDTSSTGYVTFENRVMALINEVLGLNITNTNDKFDQYLKRLKNEEIDSEKNENDYSGLIIKLNEQLFLLNYTQTTFYPKEDMSDSFVPMEILNNNSTYKATNDKYFKEFFSEVMKLIDQKNKKLTEIEQRFQQSIEDKDIKTQTYYSFKSISDKWILGYGKEGIMGTNNPLIDDFLFVDRAFNDIGDKVVIDFRPIIDLAKDYDVSVFTVMTRLLSLNGFEFFPVQNFMNFKQGQNQWEDAFKVSDSQKVSVSTSPKFICMYVGGASSQLDDPFGDFDDDGVKNLSELSDFKEGNTYGFKVAFAKQNQSLFTNIELNTNEHKETNESLSILSEIAQDSSSSSPVPKGQNLFSTFEQRSYTCKVEMLGDVMIQPTQYFILENVPMFLGAYLILQVQHNIIANHMKTSFEGVRIRKVPQPFVREFSTAVGVKGGGSDAILTGENDANNNINNVSTINPITTEQTSRLISP